MKKLSAIVVAAAVSVAALLTGCDTSETTIIMAANTAGNLGLSAWFAIDDPDTQVKTVLKDVVTIVTDAASSIEAGESYVDALTPAVQEAVAAHEKLTAAQKNLINTGASVILSGLDTFIASNEKVKTNAELASKVVAAFGKGCLTAISRSETSAEAQTLKKAHGIIRMKYDAKAKAFTSR